MKRKVAFEATEMTRNSKVRRESKCNERRNKKKKKKKEDQEMNKDGIQVSKS